MLIFLVGDRGDGKTLTAAKFASEADKVIMNFPVEKKKGYIRLKVKHVFQPNDPESKKASERYTVNWDFWKDKRNYHVFVDEAYNNFSSRKSNSVENQIWSVWVSQSRKILGNQGKTSQLKKLFKLNNAAFNKMMPMYIRSKNNFWAISQTVRKVEVNVRELVNLLIVCQQIEIGGIECTACHCYFSDLTNDAIQDFIQGAVSPKTFYYANKPYYGKYDTDFISVEPDITNQECYL